MYIPGELIPITLFIMAGAVAILTPVTRAFARRMEREGTQQRLSPELQQRLDRMEHALDAIAIEVERISEGQRFTTKLLSERKETPASIAAFRGAEGIGHVG